MGLFVGRFCDRDNAEPFLGHFLALDYSNHTALLNIVCFGFTLTIWRTEHRSSESHCRVAGMNFFCLMRDRSGLPRIEGKYSYIVKSRTKHYVTVRLLYSSLKWAAQFQQLTS